MNQSPEVSIVVAVYNRPERIKKCIESLLKLDPKSPSHEIFVIDNGSTDNTPQVVQAFPQVTYLEQTEIRGASAARNEGIRLAKGKYLAVTDSDCEVNSQWLIEGIKALQDPNVAIVGGKILGVEPPENIVQEWMNERKILDQEWVINHPEKKSVQTANAFFYMEDIKSLGGFNTSLRFGEDVDMCYRVMKKTGKNIANAPKSIVHHFHRATTKDLWNQMKSSSEGFLSFTKAHPEIPKKNPKTSFWEVYDVMRSGAKYLSTCLTLKPYKERTYAKLLFVTKAARKWGLITTAIKTKQWSRW